MGGRGKTVITVVCQQPTAVEHNETPSAVSQHAPASRGPARGPFWERVLDAFPSRRSLWQRLLLAVIITLLAAWLRMALAPAESGGRFVTLALAVVASTVFGGTAAGLLSTVLGMVIVNFFMVEPYFTLAFDNPAEALWLNTWHLITQLVIIGAIGIVQRKNQRLRDADDTARKTHRQYTATFEQAAAGITHVDSQGHLLRINQQFCDMVGYTRDELRHMRFQDITHPDDIAEDERLMGLTVAGKISQYTLEKRYIHRAGHIVWAKLTVSLIRDERGRPDFLISIVQDITEVKAINEALRTSEQLIRQSTKLAGLASWVVDMPSHRFRALFDSHRMLGLDKDEFSQEEIVAMCHPDDRQRMSVLWNKSLEDGTPYILEHRMTINGQERWILAQTEFERDATGQVTRALGVTYDITQRKRSELEVQQLNASLEARIRKRTQQLQSAYAGLESYSYAVAHDLRSPLRIINGFAQALKEDHPELDDSAHSHLGRIMGASRQMGLLIDGLLQLSQYTRGELSRQPISISHMARQQLEDLTGSEPQRQVQWSVETGMVAYADPSLVSALLQNLLGNAWKYTSAREDARIEVFSFIRDGQRYFCIRDNGAGFDMARAGKLFQPFQRMHQPGEFQGLGIGLATARRIVERHGGDIFAESFPGEGATFGFSLPSVPSGAAAAR